MTRPRGFIELPISCPVDGNGRRRFSIAHIVSYGRVGGVTLLQDVCDANTPDGATGTIVHVTPEEIDIAITEERNRLRSDDDA